MATVEFTNAVIPSGSSVLCPRHCIKVGLIDKVDLMKSAEKDSGYCHECHKWYKFCPFCTPTKPMVEKDDYHIICPKCGYWEEIEQ